MRYASPSHGCLAVLKALCTSMKLGWAVSRRAAAAAAAGSASADRHKWECDVQMGEDESNNKRTKD